MNEVIGDWLKWVQRSLETVSFFSLDNTKIRKRDIEPSAFFPRIGLRLFS